MIKYSKILISFLLSLSLLTGIFSDSICTNASTVPTASGSISKKSENTAENSTADKEAFTKKQFTSLYEEKLLDCSDNSIAYDTGDNLLITAKNNKLSQARFTFTRSFDFGTDKVNRIQINALAKRATKTYIKLYLDDETECFASFRLYNQAKEDVWTRNKEYSIDLSENEKALTGSHQIHFELLDTTTAEDKKTSVLLRSIQFVPESIPVVSLNLDEELGTISAMNSDSDHATECYGDMNIHIPDSYSCEFTDDKGLQETEGSYELDYIRGRGNSTWGPDKKPYKIKLSKKANLFGMGKNKHWVLLANYYDNSLLRNRITYYLGRELGMEYTPECVSVDVIMNHEYLGSYLLCEQVRLDENRVDENDLEDENYTGTDITGGYLLSMSPYEENANVFSTTRNTYLVESPEKGNHVEDGLAYIQDYVQKTEDAIYSSDFTLSDGTSYRDLMDVSSAIAYYWIQEFSMNGDAFISTSTYLYKKQDKDGVPGKLYWGPLWDFDYVAWSSYDYSDSASSYNEFLNQRTWFSRLMEDSSFADEIKAYWPVLKQALNKVIEKGGILDQYRDEISISANNNFDKWGYTDFSYDSYNESGSTVTLNFDQEIERLRTWITNRMNWVEENLDAVAPQKIHLTFIADGKVYAERDTYSGRSFSDIPKAPTPDDPEMAFAGWSYTYSYTDPETGEEISNDSMLYSGDVLQSDTTLTAIWLPKEDIKEVSNIYFERSNILATEGQWLSLRYAVAPLDALDLSVTWETSDSDIVKQDSDGDWMAVHAGTATITVTASNGVKATCQITVLSDEELFANAEDYYIRDYYLDQTEMTLQTGSWKQINLVTEPEQAIYTPYINWISADPEIADVSAGVVYGLQAGTTVIIAYSWDEKIYCCRVTVEDTDEPDAPDTTAKPENQPSSQVTNGIRFSKGKLTYKITSGHTVAVTGAKKKTLRKIAIPSTVKYKNQVYQVSAVKPGALSKMKHLKKVILGKQITVIGSGALRNCRQLKTVVIQSKKLRFVGRMSFTKLNKKIKITVPKGRKKSYRKFFGTVI